MKPIGRISSRPTRHGNKVDPGNDHRREIQRQIWLRLVAVFLAVVFIASECAILLPVE